MQELKLSATQQLRRDLLEKFNDVKAAREAYEFIAGGEAVVSVSDPEDVKVRLLGRVQTADRDGVYFVTKDNRLLAFGSDEARATEKARLVGIALKAGDTAIRIALKDQKDVTLTNREDPGDVGSPYYVDNWEGARLWVPNGQAATEHIKAVGTDITGLEDGWYIPSLYELYLMYLWRNHLDEALKYIGAEPFEDEWYWSSTECSATYAWALSFNTGYQNPYAKASTRYRVRPVSAL